MIAYYFVKFRTLLLLLLLKASGKIKVQYPMKCHLRGQLHIADSADIIIGSCMTEKNSFISAKKNGRLTIGRNVYINRNSMIVCREEVRIGDNTLVGPNVCIYDHDHRFSSAGRVKESDEVAYRTGSVVIGKNVWIAANCVVLRGTVIGDNSVVGAGCVVKGNYPSGSLIKNDAQLKVDVLK